MILTASSRAPVVQVKVRVGYIERYIIRSCTLVALCAYSAVRADDVGHACTHADARERAFARE